MYISDDRETSRDLCYFVNATQSNLLAAIVNCEGATNQARIHYDLPAGKVHSYFAGTDKC